MKSIKLQLIYNFKKDKGACISFGVAILITAIILNIALILMFQVDRAYNEKMTKLNVAEINICIPKIQEYDTLNENIKDIEGVVQVEQRDAVFLEATVKEFRGTDHSMNTIFYNKNEYRDINKLEIKEENTEQATNGIYLPLYVASFGEFSLEDKIIYETTNKKHEFVVSGILEEMQYGNYGQGIMGVYLTNNTYEEFTSEYEEKKIVEYSIIIDDDAKINVINNEITKLLEEKNITILINSDRMSTKDNRMMICNLLILILSVFTVVILLVSVILCKFRITSSIEEDMINMGVLKSLGYTSNMIIGCVVFQYLIVTIIASILGVIVSYGALPSLSQILALQAGFSFDLRFDVNSLCFVEGILLFIVGIFTYTASRRIKDLQPIDAIRGNEKEGRAEKNYFPLDETYVSTKIILVIKQIFSNGKKNTLLFGVSFVLTVLMSMASTLYYNAILKPNNFISTLSEEMPDVIIYPKDTREDYLLNNLRNNSDTTTVLKYMVGSINIDDIPITVFACEDFLAVSNDLCYKGRNPNKNNEVALGSIFEEQYKIGDKIQIYNGDNFYSYEITGFLQSVNYQGKVCELSIEGYSKLNLDTLVPSQYIYLKDEIDVEEFITEIQRENGEMIVSVVNYKEMMQVTKEIYSGITASIVLIVIFVTILILVIVLYIIIKTLLIQKKQELGIYKAIGYSSWELMFHIVGSLLPAPILGVSISSILGLIYIPYINNLIFYQIGAIKNNFEISFTFIVVSAILQIIIYLIISIFLSKPIRKISSYRLIKED